MSSLTNTVTKGERSKAKFPSININNIYLESRGESNEAQKQQKTANRKPGFQILGKVSTARRPANLPSVKSEKNSSEHINSNNLNNNVTSNQGWNKQETIVSVTTSIPCQTSTQSNTPLSVTINTSNVQLHTNSDKSWSSITSSGIETNQPPPKFYGSQFQQEFPSLSSDISPNQPKANVDLSFLQGPSLRPQTEGFWVSGGQTKSSVSTSESKLANNTSQLMSIQSCSTVQSSQLSPSMRNIMPSFMPKSNYPVNITTNMTKPSMSSSYTASSAINRKYVPNSSFQSMEVKTTMNVESVGFRAKPIINQDELGKMDVKTRNAGWATRDDFDYNQKLTFSDDEDSQTRNKKDEEVVNEKKQVTSNKTSSDTITKLQNSEPQQQQTENLEDEDIWNQRRLQQSKEIALAAERARKRKEEEEKRFLENKSKEDDIENSNQIKAVDEVVDKESVVKCSYSDTVEPLASLQNVERKSIDKDNRGIIDSKNSSVLNNDLNNQKNSEDKRDSYLKVTNIESLRNETYESKTSMEDYAIFDCNDYEPETSSANIGTSQWGKIDKSNKPWGSSPIVQKERTRQFTNRSSISSRDEKRQVPGPITRDKIEADDLKNEKRELVSLKPTLHGFDKKSDQLSVVSTKTTTVASVTTSSVTTSNTYSKVSSSLRETTAKNNDRNTKQTEKLPSVKIDVSSALSLTTNTSKSVANTKESVANFKTATTSTTTNTVTTKSTTTTTASETVTTATITVAAKSKRILEDGWTFASENKPNRNSSLNRDAEHNKANDVIKNVPDKKVKDDETSKKFDRSYNDKKTHSSSNKNDNRYWDCGSTYESNYNSRGRRVAPDTRKKYTKNTDYSNYDYGYDYDYNYDYEYDYDYNYDDRRRYRGSTTTKSSTVKRSSKDKGNDLKSPRSTTVNHDDNAKLKSVSSSEKGKVKEIDSVNNKPVENTKKNETNSKLESEVKEIKKSFDEPFSKRSTNSKNESQNKNQSNKNESKKSLVRKSKSDLGENEEIAENADQKSMYSDDDYSAKRSGKNYNEFYSVSGSSYRNKTRNHDRRMTSSSSNNTQWSKGSKTSSYKSSYPKYSDNGKKSVDYKDKSANYKHDTIDSSKYENSEQKMHHGTSRSYGKTFSSHKTYDENANRESRFERQKSFGNNNNVHKYSKKYSENNQETRNSSSKDAPSKPTINTVTSTSNHNHSTNVSSTTTNNAWNKPITGHLRSDSGFSSVSKSSDQTPDGVKCDSSCSENEHINENANRWNLTHKNYIFFLDDSSAPVNTIIFENTNFKSVPIQTTNSLDQGKLKFRNQSKPSEKSCININYKKDEEHLPNAMLFSKPLNDIINESLHKHESTEKNVPASSAASSLQLSMSYNKNEDNSDMKLDFGFESELNPSNEDKNKNITSATTISTGQSELNKKIQSVKKVWDTNVLEQSLHHDEDNYKSAYEANGGPFTASSNAPLDASESTVAAAVGAVAAVGSGVNIPNSTAPNICKVKPTTQTTQINSQSHVSFNIPPSNSSSVVIGTNLLEQKHSPPPQLLQILNSGSVNLNQFSQQFNANQHLSYQPNVNSSVQFNGMSTLSSPPTALVLNSNQNNLYGQLQIDQTQNRSQYAQFAAALPPHPSSYNIGQNATSPLCGSISSLYLTTPPPPAQTQDIYQNLANQYRLTQNAAFGQPQQINNPATVLISSTSNSSLMSASVKQSSQQQLSAIGTKGNHSFHQSSQHASSQAQPPQPLQAPQPQAQLYMTAPYDSAGIPSSFLSNANVLQRSTLGPPVQSNILASSLQGHSSNFYSNSNATQNAHFPQSANSGLTAASSYGIHNNIFGPSQNFGSQFLPSIPLNSNNSMTQPFRTNAIQAQNTSYLKSYSGDLRSNLNQDPMSSYNSAAAVQHSQSRNKPKSIHSPVSPSNKNFQNINTSLNKVRHTFLGINRSNITKSNHYNNENKIISNEHNGIKFLEEENGKFTETPNTEDNKESRKSKLGNKQ